MNLWRKRPLSVDLTNKELNATTAMPPSLVYISPGINSISKRFSLINSDALLQKQYFSDVTSFNSVDKCSTNTNNSMNDSCYLQSFRDKHNAYNVSFEDGTIRSSKLSNKGYFSPVSAEWLPVKDVMKIKRSASVPFHSQKAVNVSSVPAIERHSVVVKTHTSLAEKIRTLFRTRSSSRSSKAGLTPIIECNTNKNGVCLRNSRPRTKESDSCMSMYESSRVNDLEFSERLNQVLKDNATRPKVIICKDERIGLQKTQYEISQPSQIINKKKEKPPIENAKKIKDPQIHWEHQKLASSKGFSDSVISHTASSAAKCRSSPPHNTQRIKANDKLFDKKSIVKASCSKYEFPLSREMVQPIASTNYEEKYSELNKSDTSNIKTAKIDGAKIILRSDCALPNQPISSSGQCSRDRTNNFEVKLTTDRQEEDDYVTLAEVDMSMTQVYPFMSQSMHGPIIEELAKSNHQYENIDLREFKTTTSKTQPPVVLKYPKSEREVVNKTTCSQHKRRPISCMTVVEADTFKVIHKDNAFYPRSQPGAVNPKSPYLSQYTKLYSLKLTDGEIMYSQHPDVLDCDVMTRSQTSCPYRTVDISSKENSGKRSIDSGLVDDLSMQFHSDSIMQT